MRVSEMSETKTILGRNVNCIYIYVYSAKKCEEKSIHPDPIHHALRRRRQQSEMRVEKAESTQKRSRG